MVTHQPPLSRERLGHKRVQEKKIGPFADMRGVHLQALTPVETLVRKHAPLPITYDVNRVQQPYFHEYTYTELCGSGLLVSPQSVEVYARQVQKALDRPEQGFDAASAIMAAYEERGTVDKYQLQTRDVGQLESVAFIPGANLFDQMVSREALMRAMHEDDSLMIKCHPLSGPDLVNMLSRMFGPTRILNPMLSGDAVLKAAKRVYCTTTTELGLYATLMGKPIANLGDFFNESRGCYSAFYRVLWGKSPADAREALTKALNSPYGGFMHRADPDLSGRLKTYYAATMEDRALLKPLTVFTPPPPMPPQEEKPPRAKKPPAK